MKFLIADDLVLKADHVVSTAGIFATKGMGKSYLAQVMAEEMLAHGQVVVAIDPTDAWYGLRASADGGGPGYPIVVIGGDHGDLRLEPGSAIELAEAVIAERFSCVICTDGMSDLAETKFVREFLDTIYRKNREPIHIFVDEADVFAPQKPFDVEDARCIRAMSHIVRRGRKKGIGSTLITQRPAELNASVRTMVEMLFVLGMAHNLDIDAVEKWLRLRKKKLGNNAAYALQEAMIESLDTLQCGDAWVWAPRAGIHKRFRARAKRTFDSGATPKPGRKVLVPKKLAPVDLQRLGAAMSAAVQRQKDSDPSELKRQLAALRVELELKKSSSPVVEMVVERSVVSLEAIRRLESLVTKIDKLATAFWKSNSGLEASLLSVKEETKKLQTSALALSHAVHPPTPLTTLAAPSKSSRVAPTKMRPVVAAQTLATPPPDGDLKPAHLRLLSAVAWWEAIGVAAADLAGVAFIARTSTKSSAFDNNRSYLRAREYIDYPQSGRVSLTEKGRAVAPPPAIPPTNTALHEAIFAELQPAVSKLLVALIEVYPDGLCLADLAVRADTSTTSSAFDNNRSWLRARGLVEYPRTGYARATPLLFPEGS